MEEFQACAADFPSSNEPVGLTALSMLFASSRSLSSPGSLRRLAEEVVGAVLTLQSAAAAGSPSGGRRVDPIRNAGSTGTSSRAACLGQPATPGPCTPLQLVQPALRWPSPWPSLTPHNTTHILLDVLRSVVQIGRLGQTQHYVPPTHGPFVRVTNVAFPRPVWCRCINLRGFS